MSKTSDDTESNGERSYLHRRRLASVLARLCHAGGARGQVQFPLGRTLDVDLGFELRGHDGLLW